jgi:hypothetical protein
MQDTFGKARYHLEKAELWQSVAMGLEDWAMATAERQLEGRMSRRDGLETDPGYVADSLLRDRHDYKAACGSRNAHQRQAEIYMLAHIAGIRGTSWDRTESGLVQVKK